MTMKKKGDNVMLGYRKGGSFAYQRNKAQFPDPYPVYHEKVDI